MGQPVTLSDEWVCDARASAEITQRGIAGQIEFWPALVPGSADRSAGVSRVALAAKPQLTAVAITGTDIDMYN